MKKTIFIVDDDPIIRILVCDYLQAVGFDVVAFEGARQCLEGLFHQKPDLMFIDMQMPEMNGAELLQVIRHTPEYSDLPVVILSAGSDTQVFTEENYHVKAQEYLTKPFDIQQLTDVLERYTNCPAN